MASGLMAHAQRWLLRARRWATTPEGRRFLILVGAALAVRLLIAPVRGFDHDLQSYVTWGESLDHFGMHVYQGNPDVSYPPLTIYIFGLMSGIALIWHAMNGLPLDLTVRDSSWLMAFMRLPLIATDLATICLLYALARRAVSERAALFAVGVYAFLPAVLLDNNLWPQTDNVVTLGILGALVLALRGRAGWAGAALAATILIKPQPVIFAPLLALYFWRWYGWRTAARAVLGLIVGGLLLCLPFLLPPHPDILYFVSNLSAFMAVQPMASPSAYNLWWLVGLEHARAGAPWIGPLSISLVAIALFAAIFAACARRIWRDGSAQSLYIACGVAALGSFVVMTGQRERYVFPCVALFLLAGLYDRRYWIVSAIVSLALFVNHALVILWEPSRNHPPLDVSGAATYFNTHPQFALVTSAGYVALLVVMLVWLWRGARSESVNGPSCGTSRLSDVEHLAPTVVQSVEVGAEPAL